MPSQGKVKISELQVNQEYKNLLPSLSDEEFKSLEESILKDGVLHPFIINPDKVILDGHHRFRICQRHSINEVPVIERSFKTDLEEMKFVISFNLHRRHLSITQKVELGVTIHKIEMVEAKGRQSFHGGTAPGKHKTLPSNLKEVNEEQGEAIEIAAKKVGLGKITFWKGKRIAEAAQTDKHAYRLWRDIADRNRSIDSVYEELFQQEKPPTSSRPPSRPSSSIPKLEGVFQVIVIDLPTLNKEKLKRIDIPFDETNCVLWLWTPFRSLYDVTTLLIHWGFFAQTMLTWVKNKRGSGKWLLNQTEHCILATRGNPAPNSTSQSTAIIASPGEHHSKPPEFYSLVESLCTGRKLNVSSSMIKRPGWEELLMEVDANAV